MDNEFPIVTICGSMRYYPDMLQIAAEYTTRGYIVLMPFISDYVGGKESDTIKQMLDRMHYAKIAMSAMVVIVGSHRGESTVKEIEYAEHLEKTITYVDIQIVTEQNDEPRWSCGKCGAFNQFNTAICISCGRF